MPFRALPGPFRPFRSLSNPFRPFRSLSGPAGPKKFFRPGGSNLGKRNGVRQARMEYECKHSCAFGKSRAALIWNLGCVVRGALSKPLLQSSSFSFSSSCHPLPEDSQPGARINRRPRAASQIRAGMQARAFVRNMSLRTHWQVTSGRNQMTKRPEMGQERAFQIL